MKVIGETKTEYICIINHTELEKFMGQFYGKMKRLNIGDTVNLGIGYDFLGDIEASMKSTAELITKNKKVIEAILNGISVVTSAKDTPILQPNPEHNGAIK